ncbi:hypothetical protein DICPUDRAFT_151626 [Dictyostelium purpureum]|uniref:EamA domain-containing protein n=1 Tax=Dictyostelium purpureum TaxID=5786 RepID=F0ZJB9_DICPU|nr:uncharacterized protein DICPUDRAFT_151626 [Dictyostelium purpureum]EGC35936.1 hypothetical protein DICPUDRAFT_151626 [Dictyostelium purpureum]|eukprot:XP_003287509.1 hypothetical protein DICPUDRAFT_151626 [Dictyostelium purpureum]
MINKIPPILSNVINGGLLITSPLWFVGCLFTAITLEDIHGVPPLYISNLISLSSTPFVLLFSLGYQRRIGFNKKVALMPLIPITTFFTGMKLYE